MSVLPRLQAFDEFFMQVHRAVLQNFIRPSHDMKALDVGCGGGGMSILLAQALSTGIVVALDPEGEHLRETRSLARQANCAQRIVCCFGDVEELQFLSAEFDFIWCSRVIHHHLPDPHAAMSEMYRVLKPGGRLFLRENTVNDFKAATPVKEADEAWWQRMNTAQQRWFQSKFRHRRPSSSEWLESLKRAGFGQASSSGISYIPAGKRAQVAYLQRWIEGILENEVSPAFGDLLDIRDLHVARRVIDCCKELLHESDEALNRLNLDVHVSTEICVGVK